MRDKKKNVFFFRPTSVAHFILEDILAQYLECSFLSFDLHEKDFEEMLPEEESVPGLILVEQNESKEKDTIAKLFNLLTGAYPDIFIILLTFDSNADDEYEYVKEWEKVIRFDIEEAQGGIKELKKKNPVFNHIFPALLKLIREKIK